MLNRQKLVFAGLLAAAALLSFASTPAEAAARRALGLEPTCGAPAAICAVPEPACYAPAPVCCPEPCITYNSRGRHRSCYGCDTVNIVVPVKNPASCGCVVAVPMCIPACCVGEPCVKAHRGLLGRGVVVYEWCCGFKARVTFDRCGDIKVTYIYR